MTKREFLNWIDVLGLPDDAEVVVFSVMETRGDDGTSVEDTNAVETHAFRSVHDGWSWPPTDTKMLCIEIARNYSHPKDSKDGRSQVIADILSPRHPAPRGLDRLISVAMVLTVVSWVAICVVLLKAGA